MGSPLLFTEEFEVVIMIDLFTEEFEVVIMIELVTEEMHGSN